MVEEITVPFTHSTRPISNCSHNSEVRSSCYDPAMHLLIVVLERKLGHSSEVA